MSSLPNILKSIVARKRDEVATARAAMSLADLKRRVADLEDTPRGFTRGLQACLESDWTAIIAEIKRGSPSRGVIRADFDPVSIAETYAQHGAACLSVLTDETFFLGHLRFLSQIREQVRLPLLRKDFLYDPYQLWEAREAGADAILLIAAMLELGQLSDLVAEAEEIGLDVLLEIHDEQELDMALNVQVPLIGINNRDLRTFHTDLSVTERLAPHIPADRLVVAESGIYSRADVRRLLQAGAKAFLVGESLMRAPNVGAKLDELLND